MTRPASHTSDRPRSCWNCKRSTVRHERGKRGGVMDPFSIVQNATPMPETTELEARIERVKRVRNGELKQCVYNIELWYAAARYDDDLSSIASAHIAHLDAETERKRERAAVVPITVDGVEILCGSIVHIDNNDTGWFGQVETLECKVTGFTTEKLFPDYKGKYVIMANCGDEAIEFGCEDCYADVTNLLAALKGESNDN